MRALICIQYVIFFNDTNHYEMVFFIAGRNLWVTNDGRRLLLANIFLEGVLVKEKEKKREKAQSCKHLCDVPYAIMLNNIHDLVSFQQVWLCDGEQLESSLFMVAAI